LRNKVRLIHTSDLHLGDDMGHPLADGALRAVVDSVTRYEGDMLLLVGDVFDHARVPDSVLESFLDEIGRLTQPAVLLPGNHDLYDDNSLYQRGVFKDKPDNLHIITQVDGEALSFPGLTLDVWGRAMLSHTPAFRPLEGMPTERNGHWMVALAHGHFHFDDDRDQRSSPIYPPEIEAAPCDYLALGHWDRHVDVSQGKVTAVYSGTARGSGPRDPLGEVTVVDLNPVEGVTYYQADLRAGL